MPNVVPARREAMVDLVTGVASQVWFRFFAGLQPALVGTVAATLDFPATAAQTASDLTVAVPGAKDGDAVTVCVPNACMLLDSCYTGWVSSDGIATVRLNNYSAAPKNPPSGNFRVVVTRYQ